MKKHLSIIFFAAISLYAKSPYGEYQSPLGTRYSTDGNMSFIFSAQHKYATWRYIWHTLAQAEMKTGLPITQQQLDELQAHINTINFEAADAYEKKFKHDVMAHLHAFGDQCPLAKGVLHLGATSCLITDNADIMIMKEALLLVRKKLTQVMQHLAQKAKDYKNLACLSYTHFQPAQPTTVGKRMCLWLHDFMLDLQDLDHALASLSLLGIKGATGTQASFLKLYEGDHEKIKALEREFIHDLGFDRVVPIAGQTYTRKQDICVLDVLTHIAISAHKMATDLRLLAHEGECEEPHGKDQIGSSAMPYKKNPIMCEKICSLARYIIATQQNALYTAANQWLERTLDDSANRRLMIPESFLALDEILDNVNHMSEHMVIYEGIITQNLKRELPFMATENILMACAKKGADRQLMHEYIRQHSNEVIAQIKKGGSNDLLDRIAQDERIPLTQEEIEQLLSVEQFIGRALQQVEEFLNSLQDYN